MTRRGNGFGSLINKGEGKPWLGRWVYKGQVYYKSTGETDKKKALKALERITRPYRDAREEDVTRNLQNRLLQLQESRAKNALLIEDIWSEFSKKLKRDGVAEGTLHVYEGDVKNLTEWMSKKVKYAKDITPRIVEEYVEYLSTEIGAGVFNRRKFLFARIWRELSNEFQLCGDAWKNIKTKKVAKSSRRTLSNDELGMILANAESQDMRMLLTIGIYTGLRISDCALLKWSDVDFEHKIIRTVPIKTRKHMDAPVEIPIHPTLMRMLEAAPRDSEYVSKKNANGYEHGHISGHVVELFKKCGIETSKKVNGKVQLICGFHSLRHTFVSNAINSGMSPLLVQRIVGHSAVNMTEHYFHENAAKAAEGINAMPDVAQFATRLVEVAAS